MRFFPYFIYFVQRWCKFQVVFRSLLKDRASFVWQANICLLWFECRKSINKLPLKKFHFRSAGQEKSIKNYILGKIAHFWIRPFRFSSFLFFSFFNFCLLLLIFYFHVLCLILLQNYSFCVFNKKITDCFLNDMNNL